MLRRLRRYARKVFHLDGMVAGTLHDRREAPRRALPGVWMSALLMFLFSRPTLHALEQDLKGRHGPRAGKRPAGAPSERTIRRVFEWISLDELRAMIGMMVAVLRRNKVPLAAARLRGWIAAAFDGHELFASPVRGCAECLERQVTTKDRKTGQKRTHTEYYHRVVVAFVVDGLIPTVLDVELVRPGEGEIVAARRLLERVLEAHARLFDIATGDALYGDKAFIQVLRRAHKHFIIVLKDDRRELLAEADALRRHLKPRTWTEGDRRCTVWDVGDLWSWWRGPQVTLRVVWSEEVSLRPRPGRRRRGETERVASTWVWMTDLPPALWSAREVWRLGHKRWHIENRCFHDGAVHWGFDHCFHHHPNAIVAFLLTLAIGVVLVHTFLKRNVHAALRKLYDTVLGLRGQFHRDFGTDLSWSEWVRAGFASGP